jgi:hypothetical protein
LSVFVIICWWAAKTSMTVGERYAPDYKNDS